MPAISETYTYSKRLDGSYSVTGSFTDNSTLTDNQDGNDDGQTAIGDSLYWSYGRMTGTLLGTTANGVVVDFGGLIYLFTDVNYSNGTTISVNTTDPYTYCFLEGTQIETPEGARSIETLKMGDEVITSTGSVSKIRWMGHQTVHATIKSSVQHEPVCISANALGNGQPANDLYLTGSHALLIDGNLINASALCNGTTIRYIPLKEMPETFTYWHIETDAHEAIIANGVAAETFIDAPDRRSFDNYQEYVDFYGVERIIPEMNVPRITDVALLPDALKTQLGIDSVSTDWAALVANSNKPLKLKQGNF